MRCGCVHQPLASQIGIGVLFLQEVGPDYNARHFGNYEIGIRLSSLFASWWEQIGVGSVGDQETDSDLTKGGLAGIGGCDIASERYSHVL